MLPIRIAKTAATAGYSKNLARNGGKIASAVVMVSGLPFCGWIQHWLTHTFPTLFLFQFLLLP